MNAQSWFIGFPLATPLVFDRPLSQGGVRKMRYLQSCRGFSLAPSEGEKAGVRGCSVLSIARSYQLNAGAVAALNELAAE